MKRALPLLALLLGLSAQGAPASPLALNLNLYQDRHGALAVVAGGERVDPDFAVRALLSARQAGPGIETPARAWIAWRLPRQQANGGFARYCRTAGACWKPCARADADAALEALQGLTPEAANP